MCADELFFEVIDIASGTDHEICSHSLCAASVELNAVDCADIIDIDRIAVFNSQRCVGRVAVLCSVVRCASGIRAARCCRVV